MSSFLVICSSEISAVSESQLIFAM